MAIRGLNAYLKTHPLIFRDHMHLTGTSDYAEKYLGLALMKQHRYVEAANAFRVYAHCSDGSEGNYLLGVALFRSGNKTEARAKFEEVIHREMAQSMRGRDEHLITMCEKMRDKVDQSR